MNVVIVTSLFYPEIAANAKRMTDLAEGLKKGGHKVSVITAFSYYSTSDNKEKYKKKWIVQEYYKEIPIVRTYTYVCREYRHFFKRLLCFLSFMVSSVFGVFKIPGKVDAVVVISPPFFSLISAYVISRIRRAALVLDIQDIYPETLIALGFLKNRTVIRLLEWLEKFLYQKAKGIAAISEGFKHDFINKGVEVAKVQVVPNWVDINLFVKRDGDVLRKEYVFDTKFIVMFVGTMGFAQGLENVVKAAGLLADYQQKIEFVLLGEGVEKKRLKSLIREYQLSNFTFIPPKPNSEIPRFLSMADVCLVHLRKNDLYRITIPCKTYEYMALGKPIIMGVRGDALSLVEEAKCGIGVEPESSDDLARVILQMYRNRELMTKLGKNGRAFAIANCNKEKLVPCYIELIESSCSKKCAMK